MGRHRTRLYKYPLRCYCGKRARWVVIESPKVGLCGECRWHLDKGKKDTKKIPPVLVKLRPKIVLLARPVEEWIGRYAEENSLSWQEAARKLIEAGIEKEYGGAE